MIRRPPRSTRTDTLFPYTTLFRSVSARARWPAASFRCSAVEVILYGAFGYDLAIGYTLYYTTNFVFTGLAVAVAFHAGLFNIGGEGQAYIGGLGAALGILAVDHLLPFYLILPQIGRAHV